MPLRAHATFLLLGALATITVYPALTTDLPGVGRGQIWVLSAGIGLLLLVAIALHEVAHACVARCLGIAVRGVDLVGLGGVTVLDGEPATARAQYLVSIVGPLVNVLIGGLFALVWGLTDPATVPHEAAVRVAVSNTALAVYNLLPGLPLDGGQVLRAAVWGVTGDRIRGLRAAGYGGLGAAGLTGLFGLGQLQGGGSFGLFTIFIGIFVGLQARQALRAADLAERLPGVVAGKLARPAYVAAGDLPLAEALRRAADGGLSAVLLGDAAGRPTGVMSELLLARVPPQRRPWVPLSTVARALRPGMYLDAQLSGDALLEALRREQAREYVVMDGARIVGVLAVSDVAARLTGASG